MAITYFSKYNKYNIKIGEYVIDADKMEPKPYTEEEISFMRHFPKTINYFINIARPVTFIYTGDYFFKPRNRFIIFIKILIKRLLTFFKGIKICEK